MTWFLRLPPEIQIALVLQACGLIFGCGVYWATVRALNKAVSKHEKRLDRHDEKLDEHEVEIAVLKERSSL
jgi:hypothetical protein